jgi:hypothetical protein
VRELLLQFFGELLDATRRVVLLVFHAGLDAALGAEVE